MIIKVKVIAYTALELTLIGLVSMMHMNAKATHIKIPTTLAV